MAYPTVEIPEDTGLNTVSPETTRRDIAKTAIYGLFGTLVIILLGWLFGGKDIDETLKVLTTSMGVLTGIVGAIVGYYFRGDD